MHRTRAFATLALLLAAITTDAQTSRNFFNELYSSHGLDCMADQYVCFDDSPELQTFFIFAESTVLRQFLVDNGGFARLSKPQQSDLNKGFLILRGYDKGVALSGEDFLEKDGNTWVTDIVRVQTANTPIRTPFNIAWETLRYKRSVEVLNRSSSLQGEYSRYGRCEKIVSRLQPFSSPVR